MKCPNCGLETSGARGVCHVCGAVLFPQAESVPEPSASIPPQVEPAPTRPARVPVSKKAALRKSSVVTASLVLLCVALLAWIVAATRMGKPATPNQPATPSQAEIVDTNKYKVQQAIEAERARNQGVTEEPSSGNVAVPTSGSGAAASESATPASGTKSQYLLDGSDKRYVERSELAGFTKQECSLARNEIYARHGRKFQDKTIQAYFDACDWYRPTIEPEDFSESLLNAYETANRNLIVKYEKEMGYK